jgi:hypothetical protein
MENYRLVYQCSTTGPDTECERETVVVYLLPREPGKPKKARKPKKEKKPKPLPFTWPRQQRTELPQACRQRRSRPVSLRKKRRF